MEQLSGSKEWRPTRTTQSSQSLQAAEGLSLLCRQKEKRLQDEKLRGTKGLGEADAEEEDLVSWVSKSRRSEEERAKAERMARLLQEQVHSFSQPDM